MDSHERCLAALDLEEPDVVPTFEHYINQVHLEQLLGRRIARWYETRDRDRGVERRGSPISPADWVTAYKKADLDAVTLWSGTPKGYKVTWINRDVFEDEWGRLYRVQRDLDTVFWVSGSIKTMSDLEEKILPLDPYAPGRLDGCKELMKAARAHNMAVIGVTVGAFSDAYISCGIERLMVSLFREPKFATKLFSKSTEYWIGIVRQMIELGVDAIIVGDDLADKTGPMISPSFFRKFIVPQHRRLTREAHLGGIKAILHSDGNTYPLLDDIVAAGFDGHHAIEPIAGINIGQVKREYGDRLCLLGNVDCSYTLSLGSEEDVVEETKKVIQQASLGGGHLISSSNSIHNAVKFENFLTMVRTARKYGKYPIHK